MKEEADITTPENNEEAGSEATAEATAAEKLRKRYQNGFKVAVNYLYHRQPSDADKENFKAYLASVEVPDNIIEESLILTSTMTGTPSCPAGQCPDGNGGCEPCTFALAFDESYFSEPA